jgi:hypothetical protein
MNIGFGFRLTGKEKRVGGYDLIWNDGPVYADDCGLEQQKLNSFLGLNFFVCVGVFQVKIIKASKIFFFFLPPIRLL